MIAAALATGSLAACSSTPEDPKQAITEAQAKMGEQDEMSVVFDLDATPEDWTKALGGGQDAQVAANLLSETTVSLQMEATGDKPLGKETDLNKTDMTYKTDIGGKAPEIITFVGGELAMKVDMKDIAEVTGAMSEDEVRRLGREAPQEWQQAFFKGRWLSLDKASLKTLRKQAAQAGGLGTPGAAATMDPQEMLKTQAAMMEALNKNSTATYAEAKNEKGVGDAIDVSIKAKPLVEEMAKAQGAKVVNTSALSEDATINGTLWIRRGLITKAEFPLNQMTGLFDPTAFGATATDVKGVDLPGNLVVTYDKRAMIEKPINPTPVTAQDVMSLTGG